MTRQIQSVVMKKRDAATLCGISISTIDRLRKTDGFVKPIQLGTQAIGFLRKDLDVWIANRPILLHYAGTEEI